MKRYYFRYYGGAVAVDFDGATATASGFYNAVCEDLNSLESMPKEDVDWVMFNMTADAEQRDFNTAEAVEAWLCRNDDKGVSESNCIFNGILGEAVLNDELLLSAIRWREHVEPIGVSKFPTARIAVLTLTIFISEEVLSLSDIAETLTAKVTESDVDWADVEALAYWRDRLIDVENGLSRLRIL